MDSNFRMAQQTATPVLARLEKIQTCRFPKLEQSAEGEKELQSVALSCEHLQEFTEYCKQRSINAWDVVQLAWGLVLHYYAGTTEIGFSFADADQSTAQSPSPMAAEVSERLAALVMDISPENILGTLLDRIAANRSQETALPSYAPLKAKHELENGSAPVNTVLLMRSSGVDDSTSLAADIAKLHPEVRTLPFFFPTCDLKERKKEHEVKVEKLHV
jgi:hypothetical protein